MAQLLDSSVLCQFHDATVTLTSEASVDDHVVFTSNQTRIAVYNIHDQQLVNNWSAKSGHLLTSPAVKLCDGHHFAVIVDRKIIQSWSKDDTFIDQKSEKLKLSKPAKQLFPLKSGHSLILYDDGTVGLTKDLSMVWGQAADYSSLVWSSMYSSEVGVALVAVFEKLDLSRHLIQYLLTAGQDSIQAVELHVQQAVTDAVVSGYCLQTDSKNAYLLTLYDAGHVRRTSLAPGSSFKSSTAISFVPVNPSSRYKGIAELDETQIAVVRCDHSSEACVEVWDARYSTKHSEAKVDLSSLGQLQQLKIRKEALLLLCDTGVCLLRYKLRPATLLLAMNCLANTAQFIQHCQSTGVVEEEVLSVLNKLSDVSKAPDYETFKRLFAKLGSWLEMCQRSPELGLLALPLADAIIERACDENDKLWPVEELKKLTKAGLVSNKSCPILFTAAIRHRQFDLLLFCLKNVKDIPEAVIVSLLESILKKENSELFSTFHCTRNELLNLVLCLPYNECFMMECFWRLDFDLVVELVHHLHGLWESREIPHMQVCMWMYIISGTHTQLFNLFSECESLLQSFYNRVSSEMAVWLKCNLEPATIVDEDKMRAIRSNSRRHNGYYITSFTHPFKG